MQHALGAAHAHEHSTGSRVSMNRLSTQVTNTPTAAPNPPAKGERVGHVQGRQLDTATAYSSAESSLAARTSARKCTSHTSISETTL